MTKLFGVILIIHIIIKIIGQIYLSYLVWRAWKIVWAFENLKDANKVYGCFNNYIRNFMIETL